MRAYETLENIDGGIGWKNRGNETSRRSSDSTENEVISKGRHTMAAFTTGLTNLQASSYERSPFLFNFAQLPIPSRSAILAFRSFTGLMKGSAQVMMVVTPGP